ncbi:MAG TPA: 8-amino-7-oxononanoate synthase [Pirellulales bacterium]|nr:8-amino-7-oxononanoate synthase [Pirellulales bacterium]
MSDPLAWLDAELDALARRDLLRQLRTYDGPQRARLAIDGREFINFGSNDYLGLAADERLVAAASRAATLNGAGAGASPLVVGHSRAVEQLEIRLAEFEAVEAALVFASGFAANAGTIAALVGPGDAVYSDALNHASIVDGCRLSRAAVHVYRHADIAHVVELLRAGGRFRRRLIATDSLFSMDGDLAPLGDLAELARRHDCMLMIDEAHATGVFGRQGRGVAEHLGVEDGVHVRVGTLSKALGGMGGFVAGRRSLVEWLVNRARPYVFSTALAPPMAAVAQAALDIVRDEPARRQTLLARSADLRVRLEGQGWNVGTSASQIIPLLVGESARALALSAELARRGFWAPAIRPPSVPEGQARLRISLSCEHAAETIEALVAVVGDLPQSGG